MFRPPVASPPPPWRLGLGGLRWRPRGATREEGASGRHSSRAASFPGGFSGEWATWNDLHGTNSSPALGNGVTPCLRPRLLPTCAVIAAAARPLFPLPPLPPFPFARLPVRALPPPRPFPPPPPLATALDFFFFLLLPRSLTPPPPSLPMVGARPPRGGAGRGAVGQGRL